MDPGPGNAAFAALAPIPFIWLTGWLVFSSFGGLCVASNGRLNSDRDPFVRPIGNTGHFQR